MQPYDNARDKISSKKNKTRGSKVKSFYLDHKWLYFFLCNSSCFASVLSALMGLKKHILQCTTTAICRKQERHTHQLSNIRHHNTVCKSYYWTRSNMLDGLRSRPCQSGWVIFWGREASVGCQADSPQVSPSNELWTSCFGRAGQQPSRPSPENLPDTSTQAREQVAQSRRISLQFCSL